MERVSHSLLTFDGRINRVTWLLFFAAIAIAESLLGNLLDKMSGMPPPGGPGSSLEAYFDDRAGFVAGLIFLWPSLAVDVKRWHDIGMSGWLTLIVYGPALAMYVFEELKNAGIVPPAPVPPWLLSLMGLVFLVYLILVGARRGSRAANRFGAAA